VLHIPSDRRYAPMDQTGNALAVQRSIISSRLFRRNDP
jgi:hypothetical protein